MRRTAVTSPALGLQRTLVVPESSSLCERAGGSHFALEISTPLVYSHMRLVMASQASGRLGKTCCPGRSLVRQLLGLGLGGDEGWVIIALALTAL